MRAVWVDTGNDANYDKLRAYGITHPYYDHRDPRITAGYLGNVRKLGFTPGLYSAWNWYPNADGGEYAEILHQELKRINWSGNPAVCVDIETHDVDYILDFLGRWRQLRPTRRTDWTLEGFQGGLFAPADISKIVAANVGVVPQLYRGDMEPLEHSPIIDLLMAGIPGDRLLGFYDAARLPYRWHGYAFTMGRLP